jgi:hypothetical protein
MTLMHGMPKGQRGRHTLRVLCIGGEGAETLADGAA